MSASSVERHQWHVNEGDNLGGVRKEGGTQVQEASTETGSMWQAIVELERTWHAVSHSSHRSDLIQMVRIVERLTRRIQQMGLERATMLAEDLGRKLSTATAEQAGSDTEFCMQIAKDLEALRNSIEDPAGGGILLSDKDVRNQVLVLEQSQAMVNHLSREMSLFGYRLRSVADSDSLITALQEYPANAIVVDLDAPGSAEALTQLLVHVRDSAGRMLPVLGVSHSNDFQARLDAVRAGVASYLIPPIDPHDLVMELDLITHRGEPDRLHVLLIEPSPKWAAKYREILEGGGLEVTAVSQPEKAMAALQEFSPDVVLMAMYLEECTGAELARVIRQFPAHTSIPIVFLGPQTAMDLQLDAIGVGGDDFLSGPIHDNYLIRFVTIRAERGRKLRSLMLTDNLTGLLNHTRIKEQLGKELARASRRETPLSFAMVDLDDFKAVNDTYGHPAGDRVIKTLARLFKQRLRRSDYVGRYGGEEFAVIMPESTAEDAKRTLDEIRIAFGRISQVALNGTFRASFSAGVAAFPEIDDSINLTYWADQALYSAKQTGRNRIVTHREAKSKVESRADD